MTRGPDTPRYAWALMGSYRDRVQSLVPSELPGLIARVSDPHSLVERVRVLRDGYVEVPENTVQALLIDPRLGFAEDSVVARDLRASLGERHEPPKVEELASALRAFTFESIDVENRRRVALDLLRRYDAAKGGAS